MKRLQPTRQVLHLSLNLIAIVAADSNTKSLADDKPQQAAPDCFDQWSPLVALMKFFYQSNGIRAISRLCKISSAAIEPFDKGSL